MTSTTSLRCLGCLQLEWDRDSSPLPIEPATQPIELLLRVAAAGPGGASATMLCAAMWLHITLQARRRSLHAVLVLDGIRISVNGWTLGVDSIDEETIAPLLNPFSVADERERARHHQALAGSAAQHATEFLSDIPRPWAVQARLRIANRVQRARRMPQIEMLEVYE